MKPRRTLTLAELGSSIGDGAFFATSALYFTSVIGLSVPQVGLVLAFAWGLGAVAGVPLGRLADRCGPRDTAASLAIGTAAAVLTLLFVGSFLAFVLVICAFACCQTGLSAARQALLAALVAPAERTRVRARLQAIRNAGIALGAALGGLVLYVGTATAYRALLAMVALTFVVTACLLPGLPRVSPSPGLRAGGSRLAVLRDRPYALTALINMVLLLHMPLLSVVLPLWIAQRTAAPPWTVAVLWAVNTLSVVLLQVRIARRVSGLGDAARLVRTAGLIMLAGCVTFTFTALEIPLWGTIAALLGGTVLMVLGEMMLASGSWEISFGLAPEGMHGQYQGFFGMGLAIARMIGPLFATLIVGAGAPGWLALGVLILGAGLGMAPAVRWAARMNSSPDQEAWISTGGTRQLSRLDPTGAGANHRPIISAWRLG